MDDKKIKVTNIIKELKNISEIDNSIDFIDSGFLDSFDLINLISRLEEEFNIKVEGEEIIPENFGNVDSIVDLVNQSEQVN